MAKLNLTAPDPFNHGNCSLSFREVSSDERTLITLILEAGWGISKITGIKAFDRAAVYSDAFVVHSEKGAFVLRACKTLDAQKQRVVDEAKRYAEENGLPVPTPWASREKLTYFVHDKLVYSLCDFIVGEHFDGSRENLKQAAELQARFHQIFSDYPRTDDVRKISGDVYPRDETLWQQLKESASAGQEDFDQEALKIMEHVDGEGAKYKSDFSMLPKEIGHFDWHPQNLLFSTKDHTVLALLDFDLMRYSERARDVAIAMHKFGRVFGANTEKKHDLGSTLDERCVYYLNCYQVVNFLSEEEISLIPDLLFDEIKRKLIYIFNRHYFQNDFSSDFDIEKQFTQLNELDAISSALRKG